MEESTTLALIWAAAITLVAVVLIGVIGTVAKDSNATELQKVQECLKSGKQWVYVDNTVEKYECVSIEG
jgi:hypothetical protein